MNLWISVFLGGGLGSVARFGIARLVLKYFQSGFPWATLISNLSACLILALSMVFLKDRFQQEPLWRYFIIIGFCGGFSTFSAFSYENYVLFRNDHLYMALLNVVVSIALGFVIMMVLFKDFHFET